MAEATIPVDLRNPGQVFACLGFLEAADILLGDAEGGFDWSDEANPIFRLRSSGEKNPFAVVLEFLRDAKVVVLAPHGIHGPWPTDHEEVLEFPCATQEIKTSNGKGYSSAPLPTRLVCGDQSIPVSHWLRRKSLDTCKLFAGKQIAAQLMQNMLTGDPNKKGALGLCDVFDAMRHNEFHDPFHTVCAVGGRFGFDARGSWDAIRIGSSLDMQGALVRISPHVEILAAIGLENTRPAFLSTYQIRYAVWNHVLPISLCRVALFSPSTILADSDYRYFKSHLGEDKQYKKIFFAHEESPT